MAGISIGRRRRALAAVPEPPRPREAFVLSGGGSLGAAQVGALRALFEAGIRPDVLVGCSVGALNAAFLAIDPSPSRQAMLENLWRRLDGSAIFAGSRSSMAGHLLRRDNHLYEPHALLDLIHRWVPLTDLSATAVPVHVVTTDLVTGEPHWWSSGDPAEVLGATACLPGVFPPVALGGSLHVDGGITCPVPVGRAVELGALRIWVLDVSGPQPASLDDRMSALDVLLRSFAISRSHINRTPAQPGPGQRIVRVPSLVTERVDLRDFSRTAQLLEGGYTAMHEVVARELGQPEPKAV